MAASRKKNWLLQFVNCCLFYFYFTSSHVHSERTAHKIYIELSTQSACFRNMNATHQIGCTSDERGNVGTIHYIQSQSDFEWIYSKGPHSPYIAVLKSDYFNRENVKKLIKSNKVNGIMVINVLSNKTISPYPPDGFSSVDPCPNDRYGLYAQDENYTGCKRKVWNPFGSSLHNENLGIPVFALSDPTDVDAVLNKCYFPFNEPIGDKARDYPLCSAELKARMDGAVNSVVCMRRTQRTILSLSGPQQYCDPLGDRNVVTLLKNETSKRQPNSVILVGTKLDATGMFQNEYYAADTTVAGVVALLATAEALWKVKHELLGQSSDVKDILFTFFQGETFDYIGSSRIVYDMKKGDFPQDITDRSPKAKYLSNITLDNIDQIIELNQVGLAGNNSGTLWAHFDPINRSKKIQQIDSMVNWLNNFGKLVNLTINSADAQLPLPPASAQRFLKERRDIPVVLLTDHQAEFENKYYNSRFDTAENLGLNYPADSNDTVKYNFITKQAQQLADLSTTLAKYLYNASSGRDDSGLQNISADPLTVTRLLYCFLISPNCEMFMETIDPSNAKSLKDAKQPFPFYVSVDSQTNQVTQLVYSLMARFTGEKVDLDKNNCQQDKEDKQTNFFWMQGAMKSNSSDEREGWCYKAIVHYTKAVSPAFDIDGYDLASGDYSSWTESRWGPDAIGVRLFLMPSPEFQLVNIVVGVCTLLFSFLLVFFIGRSDLFPSPSQEIMTQQ